MKINARQFDIEILKPRSGDVREFVHTEMRQGSLPSVSAVTGIQKAVQRYVHLIQTVLGTVHFKEHLGSKFMESLRMGGISNRGRLSHLFLIASTRALDTIRSDDSNSIYGELPDDERLMSAELVGMDVDGSTGTVSFEVKLTTAAGSSYTYEVPVEAI